MSVRYRLPLQPVTAHVRVDPVTVDAHVLDAGQDERRQFVRLEFHQVLQLQVEKSARNTCQWRHDILDTLLLNFAKEKNVVLRSVHKL